MLDVGRVGNDLTLDLSALSCGLLEDAPMLLRPPDTARLG
jgi:hypothetical protein